MSGGCRKFVPNVFDIKKCQNCFKSKDYHSRNALSESSGIKKVVAHSYLFISPNGLDFRNVNDRSKRWQRRFFVLHDDGELLFSIDENSQAIPQGRIHMSSCRSVHSGEEITGHINSIALHLDNGESYFLRAASREEVVRWEKLLSAYCPAHQKRQSPLQRFEKFCSRLSGPAVSQPVPPPRQQPPKPQRTPPTAASPGTTKVYNNRVEYIETDLDYDLSASNSKSANSSPFGTKGGSDRRLGRRRPGSVGDQLKSLLNSPGAGSPQEERGSADGKELTYLKKGWLYVQAPTDAELQKRWCVLSDGCVTIYRSSLDEDHESPEFALPLIPEAKSPVLLHEASPDLTYGFLLETAAGNVFSFAAMTAGIRSNWVQALRTCLRLRTAAARCNVRRVPAMRRHTTGARLSSGQGSVDTNGSDLCDAEVSLILTKKSKFEEPKSAEPTSRAFSGSKTSESSVPDNTSISLRSGRNSRETAGTAASDSANRLSASAEAEVSALRSRVTELSANLDSARAQVVDLEARLSLREAECLGLSDQCQRLELDVFERERIVSLPTDEERQLKRQLAAHDEALRASHERCERAERCADEMNARLGDQLAAADEELVRALRERDEAVKERTSALADRDALERRWKAERAHWETALSQNEADNARLEAERRLAEERLSLAQSTARDLETAVQLRAHMTLAEFGLPEALLDESTAGLTVEALATEAAALRSATREAVAAKAALEVKFEEMRSGVEAASSLLREELRASIGWLRSGAAAAAAEPLTECQALAESLTACLEAEHQSEASLPTLFRAHLAPALRAVDAAENAAGTAADERRRSAMLERAEFARRRLEALLALCGARLARDASGGANCQLGASLEAAAVAAANRLLPSTVPAPWCLAAAVGLRNNAPEKTLRALRALCRQQVAHLVSWLAGQLQCCLLREEAASLCHGMLQKAALRSLQRCCDALKMARPPAAEARIATEVARLMAAAEKDAFDQEEEMEGIEEEAVRSVAEVPGIVALLAMLDDGEEDGAAPEEREELPVELRDGLLSEKEWREATLSSLAGYLETAYVIPLRERVKAAEEENALRRTDLAERDQCVRDLEAALLAKQSEVEELIAACKSAKEGAIEADKRLQEKTIQEKKTRELALEPPTNGRRQPADEALRFWRREVRALFESELRSASPSATNASADRDKGGANLEELQAALETERESHKSEMARLRSEFDAALKEEARQTKLALEAVSRQHREALEREKERLRAEAESLTPWLAHSAVENHLETIAKRLAALPPWENGETASGE